MNQDSLVLIFGEENTKKIILSQQSYLRLGIKLYLKNLDQQKLEAIFEMNQNTLINGLILNNKQLYERAKEVLNYETSYKIHIGPCVFEPPYKELNIEWIQEKMKLLGLTKNVLVKQLALDKIILSQILTGKIPLTKSFKATLFYYFLQFEVNRDLRKEIT